MNFTDFILIIYLTPLIRRYSNFILYKRKCEILSYFCFLLGGEGEGGRGRKEGEGEGKGGEGRSFMANFLRQSLIMPCKPVQF